MARTCVSSEIVPPASAYRRISPARYLNGWNCAWSGISIAAAVANGSGARSCTWTARPQSVQHFASVTRRERSPSSSEKRYPDTRAKSHGASCARRSIRLMASCLDLATARALSRPKSETSRVKPASGNCVRCADVRPVSPLPRCNCSRMAVRCPARCSSSPALSPERPPPMMTTSISPSTSSVGKCGRAMSLIHTDSVPCERMHVGQVQVKCRAGPRLRREFSRQRSTWCEARYQFS
jgi:hypothetical protein